MPRSGGTINMPKRKSMSELLASIDEARHGFLEKNPEPEPDTAPPPATTVAALMRASKKKPSAESQANPSAVPEFGDQSEEDWVKRYIDVTDCDLETARMVYRGARNRGHEVKEG